MNQPVNLVEFVKSVSTRQRGRACIILTQKYEEQKEWAARLAQQTGSEHIDLLDRFAKDQELSCKTGNFMVSNLYKFLEGHCQNSRLVVSGLEFLIATWTAQPDAMDEFLTQLNTWERNPGLIFVIQYQSKIMTYNFGRRFNNTYVVDQRETLAL